MSIVLASLARSAALAALLGVVACSGSNPTTVDVAVMPTGPNGVQIMSDQGAISLASYSLSEPSRTRGDVRQGALAMAAVDYLAGRIDSAPQWIGLPGITKEQMIQGRNQVRMVLGVAPGTPSQAVVNGLIAVSVAPDAAAARAALPASVFTQGPTATLALLANLPYMQVANAAAQAIDHDVTFSCSLYGVCGG